MPAIAKLSDEDVKFLETVFPGALITKPEELNVYVSDASLQSGSPLCCVLPERVEQVQALFAWADEKRIPIYVRGRGTNLVGDCVAFKPGLV
ncbi:MAG: FAD-binding oxidoreductase, partial [Desulfovibrio sp.]|nr:FAD-binding oxidoreductase [Desulfovibrio sp.]